MQHPWFADMNTRLKTIPYKPKLSPSALSPRLLDRTNEKLKEPSITIRERGAAGTPREKGLSPREMPWVARESPRSPRDRERTSMSPKERKEETSPKEIKEENEASMSPKEEKKESEKPSAISPKEEKKEAKDRLADMPEVPASAPTPKKVEMKKIKKVAAME